MKKESSKNKKIKKVDNDNKNQIIKVVIGIVAAALVIVGLFFLSEVSGDRSNDKKPVDTNQNNSTSSDEENPLIENGETWKDDEVAELEEIDLKGLKSLVKEKNVTIVMLGTESCYWCVNQKPVLQHALYLYPEVHAVYLDVSKIGDEGYEYLKSLDSNLSDFGTPTFISVKNGKVTNTDFNGARGVSALKEMFKDMGAM